MHERIIENINQIIENPDAKAEAATKALQEMATKAGFEDMSDACAAYIEVLKKAGRSDQITVELTPEKIRETLKIVVSSAIISFALSQEKTLTVPTKGHVQIFEVRGLFQITRTHYVIHRKVDPSQYIQLFRIYLKVYNSIAQATGEKQIELISSK